MVLDYFSELYRQYNVPADKELAESLKNILGLHPRNLDIYKLAFRHRSVAEEVNDKYKKSNERLEYLGDSILGSAVAHYLFLKFPFKDEGFLTEMRSKIVNRNALNKLGEKMGLDKFIEIEGGGATRKSVLGDCFEALIGALYLDHGFETTKNCIIDRIVKVHYDLDNLMEQDLNIKNKLIYWAQKEGKVLVIDFEERTSQNKKFFTAFIKLDGIEQSKGIGPSKKLAEEVAISNFIKHTSIL